MSGYYVDTSMMIFNIAYSVRNNVPYSVFGDAVSLSIQNVVIIYLIWSYNKEINVCEKIISSMVLTMLVLFLFTSELSQAWWDVVLDMGTLFSKFQDLTQYYRCSVENAADNSQLLE